MASVDIILYMQLRLLLQYIMYIHIYMYIHVKRDAEGRKKEASKVIQITHPRQSLFYMYMHKCREKHERRKQIGKVKVDRV